MDEYRIELFCFEGEVCDKGDSDWVALEQLNLPHDLLQKLQETGIIEVWNGYVKSEHILRIFKALRLRRTLGINFTATAIIIELLDRVSELEEEVEALKKQLR